MPPSNDPAALANVDPTPIPLRWVPVLSLEEAGEVLAAEDFHGALAAVLPSDRRRGGLSFGTRRAMIQARVAVGASNCFARAAADSARRKERKWRELADPAAQPEWDRALLYSGAGATELQLAED